MVTIEEYIDTAQKYTAWTKSMLKDELKREEWRNSLPIYDIDNKYRKSCALVFCDRAHRCVDQFVRLVSDYTDGIKPTYSPTIIEEKLFRKVHMAITASIPDADL